MVQQHLVGRKALLQGCSAEAASEWVSSLTSAELLAHFGSMLLGYTERWTNSLVWFSRLDCVIQYCPNQKQTTYIRHNLKWAIVGA